MTTLQAIDKTYTTATSRVGKTPHAATITNIIIRPLTGTMAGTTVEVRSSMMIIGKEIPGTTALMTITQCGDPRRLVSRSTGLNEGLEVGTEAGRPHKATDSLFLLTMPEMTILTLLNLVLTREEDC